MITEDPKTALARLLEPTKGNSEIKPMLNKKQVFDKCRAVYGGVLEAKGGVAGVTVLANMFSCMRSRLIECNASDDDRQAFVHAIIHAITTEPGLQGPTYEHDRNELQKLVVATINGLPYQADRERPLLAPKFSFLSRVMF